MACLQHLKSKVVVFGSLKTAADLSIYNVHVFGNQSVKSVQQIG